MSLLNATKPTQKGLKWRKRPVFEGSPRANRSVLNFQPLRKVQRLHAARLGANAACALLAGGFTNSLTACWPRRDPGAHRACSGLLKAPCQVSAPRHMLRTPASLQLSLACGFPHTQLTCLRRATRAGAGSCQSRGTHCKTIWLIIRLIIRSTLIFSL